MQFDMYANLKVSKDTDLYMKFDIRPDPNHEFFILFKNVFNRSWIKLGKSLPAYGLKLDDHTSFIRGGNLTSVSPKDDDDKYIDADIDKGLFFNPQNFDYYPILLESGFTLSDHFRLNIGIAQDFINDEKNELVNTTATLSYLKELDNISILSGLSFMNELDVKATSIFGGVSFNKFALSYEIDKTENWILDSNSKALDSRANYFQMVYKPIQGLHFIAKYDFFDKNYDILDGDIARMTFGVELYLLNMFELDFQFRQYEINNIDLDYDISDEFLMQLHTWF